MSSLSPTPRPSETPPPPSTVNRDEELLVKPARPRTPSEIELPPRPIPTAQSVYEQMVINPVVFRPEPEPTRYDQTQNQDQDRGRGGHDRGFGR